MYYSVPVRINSWKLYLGNEVQVEDAGKISRFSFDPRNILEVDFFTDEM